MSAINHGDGFSPPTAGTRNFDVATYLSELARSFHQKPAEYILTAVVDEAIETIVGTEFASLSVITNRQRIASVAPSADLPLELDKAQARLGEGPCLAAIHDERIVRVPDMSTETRWPAFARHAVRAGVGSMLAFRLFVDGDTLGALNLYSSRKEAFTTDSEHIGLNMSVHAALALAESHTRGQLREAIFSRGVIGQAKGILMERYKITEHEAFLLLTASSSHSNRKLRTIAEELSRTGVLPAFPPPEQHA